MRALSERHGVGSKITAISAPKRKSRMRATYERLFIAHPRAVNEDYLSHAGVALRFARLLFRAAFAALVHAVIPALFETSASSTINQLHGEMLARSAASKHG
jgi:hypothetical protein